MTDRPDIDEAKRNMFAAMRADCTRPCIVCGKPVELPEDLPDWLVVMFHMLETLAPMVATCDDCDDGTDDQADRVVRLKGGRTAQSKGVERCVICGSLRADSSKVGVTCGRRQCVDEEYG